MFTNLNQNKMKKIFQTIQFLFISALVSGQPVLQWENRFDYQGGYDSPRVMQVDQNNNICIAGFSSNDTFKLDILTLKINSDGTTAWHNIIRNDYDDVPSGLAIDNEGNCYLGGGLGDIFLDEASVTLRYNTDGAQAWIDTQGNSLECIAIDQDNNIYSVFGGSKIYIVKYDPEGNILLEFANDTSYSGHKLNTRLFAIVDSNLYISGTYHETGNDSKAFLKKISNQGNVLVDVKFNSASDDIDTRFMQVDALGNVYLLGWIGFYDGMFLVKFDNIGNVVWDKIILDGSGLPYDLILDADQNPVICGKVYEVNEITEYIIKKYDHEGNEVWTDYPGKAGPYFEEVAHLVSDASGNIYFAASTWPVAITEPAFLIVKYDKFGNKLWEYKEDSILYDQNDYIAEMAFDFENNIIMALQSRDSTGNKDVVTFKFSDLTGIQTPETITPALTVSPNPFHSTATINVVNPLFINIESTISLLDLFGREISTAAFYNSYQLNRTGISNGMYLLKVVSGGGITTTAKVIIY